MIFKDDHVSIWIRNTLVLLFILCDSQCFSYSHQIALEKSISLTYMIGQCAFAGSPLLFPSKGVKMQALDSKYKIYQF